MSGMRLRTSVHATLVAVSAFVSVGVMAQSAHRVEVAAQQLDEALRSLGRQTGTNVIFEPRIVKGIRASAVSGELGPEEAIRLLLAGTGLAVERISDDTVVVKRIVEKPTAAADREEAMQLAQASSSSEQSAAEKSDAKGADAGVKLEEVVVTAQKRKERLQDVPISMSVLSGTDLDRSSARGIADVLGAIGGVSVIEYSPGNMQVTIRGVVADPNGGLSTSAYYIDEVPISSVNNPFLPDTSPFDLARIEVLRGPQGTLYGGSALSGVVRIISNDVDLDRFGGKGRTRISTTEGGGTNFGGDLAVNVPLVDGKFGVRAVASYQNLDGYVDSTAPGLAKNINDTQAKIYSVKTEWRPNDAWRLRLGAMGSDIDVGSPDTRSENGTTHFTANRHDNRRYDLQDLVVDYSAPLFSLLSSTSYIDFVPQDGRGEIDFPPILNFRAFLGFRAFSQELRATSHLEGPWQLSAGAIYKDTTQTQIQDASPTFPGLYHITEKSEGYAVFSEITRKLANDRFELTGGLRYSHDDVVTTQQSGFFPDLIPLAPRQSGKFEHVTYRSVLSYKPSNDLMLYGSVGTGFRSGIEQAPAVASSFPNSVRPDSLINYEVGAKGSSNNGMVSFDTAVYYTDWKDIQQSLLTDLDLVARLNSGRARGLGVDAGIALRPTNRVSLQASLGWNGLEFAENIFSGPNNDLLFAKGERINLSPEWSGSVSGDWRPFTLAKGVDTVVHAIYKYRSNSAQRALIGDVVELTNSGSNRSVDVRLGLESERWAVDLFADNLTNRVDSIDPTSSLNGGESTRLKPRTIGVQASMKFDGK